MNIDDNSYQREIKIVKKNLFTTFRIIFKKFFIMKKTIVIVRVILACLCILFAFYVLFTTGFYNHSSGLNYRSLLIFLILLFAGILQLFQRNEPFEKGRFKLLFWTLVVIAFVILILTVINQKAQIKKMEKIEQSESKTK